MTSPSPPPPQPPPDPSSAGGGASPAELRLRRRVTLLILVLGALAAGGWRYRITRPDYRLARGEEAIRAGDAEAARGYADRLEAAGYPDHAPLLSGEALPPF